MLSSATESSEMQDVAIESSPMPSSDGSSMRSLFVSKPSAAAAWAVSETENPEGGTKKDCGKKMKIRQKKKYTDKNQFKSYQAERKQACMNHAIWATKCLAFYPYRRRISLLWFL